MASADEYQSGGETSDDTTGSEPEQTAEELQEVRIVFPYDSIDYDD